MNTTVTEKLSNGNTIEYKVINGTAYHNSTPQTIINILENARLTHKRIRIFYGDVETGKDWKEEYDTIGFIGRSTGNIKIPLLIKTERSFGGGALLDHCIVKITVDKKTVYQHNNYNTGSFEIKNNNMVYCNNINIANFKTNQQAKNYIAFLQGINNRK